MKLSKCIKILLVFIFCLLLLCPLVEAKSSSRQHKKASVVTINAEPFEIDEEFKGEFEYFDSGAEKLKTKENKAAYKKEKKQRAIRNKKQKLEQKRQNSENNIEKYNEYKEQLENSFRPLPDGGE